MKKLSIIFAASVIALSGCANVQMGGVQPQGYQTNQNIRYGKLINVREYGVQKNESNGLAVAGGAVVGGLLGNQIGGGRGKTLATIAGVAAGAYAGNELSKTNQVVPMVELLIQDDNGQRYTINQEKNAHFYTGQRVRVSINGNVGTVTPY